MTVSAVETLGGALAASTPAVVTVTTSLVPADRLVVIVMKSGTAGVPAVSGLGTWSTLQSNTLGRDSYLFTASGITGGGNVTITPGTASANGDYVLYVLRSSVGAQVDVFGSAVHRSSSGGADQTSDIASGLTGMFSSAAASMDPGVTPTFPAASMLPASGWTTSRTAANVDAKFIHQQLVGNSTIRAAVSGSGGSAITIIGAFTDGDTGTSLPPLADTFVGWGNPIF